MGNIDKYYHWYLANQDELVDKYNGKYLVIKDNSVVGVYDSETDAYFESVEKFGLGNFLIQLCSSDKLKNTQMFYNSYVLF